MAQPDLKEALQIINSGDWVALRYITADIRKGIGGKVMELNRCRLAKNRGVKKNKPKADVTENVRKKDPRHHEHFTLNMELPNKMLRKVHPPLITHINNRPLL